MADAIEPEQWYQPDLQYLPDAPGPSLTVLPLSYEFGRELYRVGMAGRVESAPLKTSSGPLKKVPWLCADAATWMFDAAAREAIDSVGVPGEYWWLPVEVDTPDGIVAGYEVPMRGAVSPGVFCACHTTFGANGSVIRWVLDPTQMDGREFLVAPAGGTGYVVMKGSLIQRLIDLGAEGVVLERARVCPNAPKP